MALVPRQSPDCFFVSLTQLLVLSLSSAALLRVTGRFGEFCVHCHSLVIFKAQITSENLFHITLDVSAKVALFYFCLENQCFWIVHGMKRAILAHLTPHTGPPSLSTHHSFKKSTSCHPAQSPCHVLESPRCIPRTRGNTHSNNCW